MRRRSFLGGLLAAPIAAKLPAPTIAPAPVAKAVAATPKAAPLTVRQWDEAFFREYLKTKPFSLNMEKLNG